MIQIVIFVLSTAGILWFSWKPLHDRRAHGFYRFFAVEAILALVLLNAEQWFRDPFSALQIVSWLLLMVSIFLVVHGSYLLRVVGKPRGSFENTSTLVRIGAYQYIRHPLYSSLLFLAWGAFLKDPTWMSGALVLIASLALVATAKVEEAENTSKFGAEYLKYAKTTRMFVPFVF